jgi:retron-type reverse transcriptase
MSNNKRQQLYDRIRASSKDEVILEEMKRLGFWPADSERPNISETLIQRKGELERELNQLLKQQHLYSDPQAALKAMRKQRMAESKQRQQENRKRRIIERHEKALRWHERRQQEIIYLGEGVSAGLDDTSCDTQKLAHHPLPEIATAKALSDAMGISLAELRFLSYSREISRINHYQHFVVAKKTGGERLISAPMPRLKRAQYWILGNILEKIPLHDAAHGFRPGRSIVSNALPHCQAHIVLNHDFKDFFPTLKYPRIRGLYRSLGYSEQVATILALLTTEPDNQQVELDGDHYYVRQGERYLPQGAPTSPALTNLLCRRLDARLQGAAHSLGFRYTRYADDLTFSADRDNAKNLRKLQWRLEKIVTEEGFALHPEKSRVMRNSTQQEVTGIVVNEKPSIDRKTLRRFRALLHRMERQGPDGCHWGDSPNVLSAARGYANFIAMVDRPKGQGYLEQIGRIIERYGQTTHRTSPTPLSPALFKAAAAAGKPPRDTWWIAKEPPPPEMPKLEEKPPRQAEPLPAQVTRESPASGGEQAPRGDAYGSLFGFLRRFIGKLLGAIMVLIALLFCLVMFRVSPILGLIFAGVIIYFLRGLRGRGSD